jgi:predicted nucleic acid-binding Zn ribbon protein
METFLVQQARVWSSLDLKQSDVYPEFMAERKGSLTSLREILDRMLKNGGLPFEIEDARIWQVWEKAVGVAVARHARPIWIKQGLLRVGVSDPIWLQELSFQEGEIREKLNRALAKEAVKAVEFRLEK